MRVRQYPNYQWQGVPAGSAGLGWTFLNNAGNPTTADVFRNAGMGYASSGGQYIELNIGDAGTVYQNVTTTPGTLMRWSFRHRAHTDVSSTAEFRMGPPGSTTVVSSPTSNVADGWRSYAGSYVIPPGQTTTQLRFRAVSPTGFNGNRLDRVLFAPMGK